MGKKFILIHSNWDLLIYVQSNMKPSILWQMYNTESDETKKHSWGLCVSYDSFCVLKGPMINFLKLAWLYALCILHLTKSAEAGKPMNKSTQYLDYLPAQFIYNKIIRSEIEAAVCRIIRLHDLLNFPKRH